MRNAQQNLDQIASKVHARQHTFKRSRHIRAASSDIPTSSLPNTAAYTVKRRTRTARRDHRLFCRIEHLTRGYGEDITGDPIDVCAVGFDHGGQPTE